MGKGRGTRADDDRCPLPLLALGAINPSAQLAMWQAGTSESSGTAHMGSTREWLCCPRKRTRATELQFVHVYGLCCRCCVTQHAVARIMCSEWGAAKRNMCSRCRAACTWPACMAPGVHKPTMAPGVHKPTMAPGVHKPIMGPGVEKLGCMGPASRWQAGGTALSVMLIMALLVRHAHDGIQTRGIQAIGEGAAGGKKRADHARPHGGLCTPGEEGGPSESSE